MINRKVLIVTHSDLAEGFKASIEFFIGDKYPITTICAFTRENNVQEVLKDYFDNLDPADEVIAFSDVLFGSVNQWLGVYKNREHYHLFTGTNLPIILSILLKSDEEYLTLDEINASIAECANSVIYVNTFNPGNASEDDE